MSIDQFDNALRWLYEHSPVARSEVRKLIRASVGERDVVVRGLTWRCHPRDNAIERSLWLSGGTEEDFELDWLIGRLRADQVFCDIGSNCGFYALNIRVATGARVVAIEPNPVMRDRLSANARANSLDGIILDPNAVGDSTGRMTLHMGSKWDYGQASLIDNSNLGIEVEVRPLKDILASNAISKVDAIKIDIEGYEDRAIGMFFATTSDESLPHSLVIEHLHQKAWRQDFEQLAASRGYKLAARTSNNLLLER